MMRTAANVSLLLIRILAAIEIILGIIIWFGAADAFIPVHIVGGVILVFSLWSLAIASARLGVKLRFVVFTMLWGLMVAILGLIQDQLVPDQGHWIIQVVHLLVGLSLIGLAQRLAMLIKQK
jgi:hypothetical protein